MKRSLAVIVSMLLLASGCGDDGGGPVNLPSGDTDPPVIVDVLATNANQIQVTFNEALDPSSAQRRENYVIVEGGVPAAELETQRHTGTDIQLSSPGDTLVTASAALVAPSVVLLSLFQNMTNTGYGLLVKNVEDLSGNAITTPDTTGFAGSTSTDNDPPEFLSGTPQGNNVGVGQTIIIQFSEPMDVNSVIKAFSLRVAGNLTPVAVDDQGNIFSFTPVAKLPNGTTCTVRVDTDAKDWAGNALTTFSSFVFSTTSNIDVVAPTLTAVSPSDGRTNVSVNTTIVLSFSEAIEPTSLDGSGEGASILLYPSVDGSASLSSSGTQVTFTPFEPLGAATFYSIMIPDGAVRDLAGNPLVGTTTVQFTTGSTLPTGSLTGIITGSGQAANPGGTIVVASTSSLFGENDDPEIRGTGIAAGNGAYAVNTLPDSWYFPFGIMDSNNDGFLDPERGDAFGVFGVDVAQNDLDPDSVLIQSGGAAVPANFTLFDAVSISGTVVYGGSAYTDSLSYFSYLVGLFDTTGFDTAGTFPSPDFGNDAERISEQPHFSFSSLFGDAGLDPGTYFVGAFLDVNNNDSYEPAIDPVGFYQSGGQFTPVTVLNGTDWDDVNITLIDPGAAATGELRGNIDVVSMGGAAQQPPTAVRVSSWRAPGDTDTRDKQRLRRMAAAIRRAASETGR